MAGTKAMVGLIVANLLVDDPGTADRAASRMGAGGLARHPHPGWRTSRINERQAHPDRKNAQFPQGRGRAPKRSAYAGRFGWGE